MKSVLTVCIPVFNAERTINRCIQAVLRNLPEHSNVLVVDNCSTDRTREIVRSVAERDCRLRLVSNAHNLGRIGNWNKCLELADGVYLKFALANDVLLDNSLPVLLRAATAYPDSHLICSRGLYLTSLDTPLPPAHPNPDYLVLSPREAIEKYAMANNYSGGLNGILLRTRALKDKGIRFREEVPFLSDLFFAAELSNLGQTIALNTETFAMDLSVGGRFYHHVTNQKLFFDEQRQFITFLKPLLQIHGTDTRLAYTWTYAEFLRRIQDGYRPTIGEISWLFAGESRFFLRAAIALHVARFQNIPESMAQIVSRRIRSRSLLYIFLQKAWRRLKRLNTFGF